MDFEAKLEEIVIVSLIFGVRAVSALSERALIELAAKGNCQGNNGFCRLSV